ncbi:hypothetical protein I307_02866 [Cryptococcus deuterogattii 99/473]|uniref:Uncharacterized protein n=1 Tax=Cryptococcus deuterogattii Ram5 TaxID=1296110 RepID=A0A0D0UU73_9TREE|nr:hypothetical protein I313_05419 [Cryptococcus deuterogattii Ram5]KIY57793.1 hypothetical protein I307_02866 [Cryptococcus deuterogattii 99/473]
MQTCPKVKRPNRPGRIIQQRLSLCPRMNKWKKGNRSKSYMRYLYLCALRTQRPARVLYMSPIRLHVKRITLVRGQLGYLRQGTAMPMGMPLLLVHGVKLVGLAKTL